MRRLLIINNQQFGYDTDTFYYCKYLRDEYDSTYLCWDYGYAKVDAPEGVNVIYISRDGGKIARLTNFIRLALERIKTSQPDVTIVMYFRLCFLIKLFSTCRNTILDVRTGYVLESDLIRFFYNTGIWIESLFFDKAILISEELRDMLHIPASKCRIIPLGAESWEFEPETFNDIRLIYVGTFTNRNIYKTVEGFDRFVSENGGQIQCRYDIVGFGTPEEEARMHNAIEACKHKDRIRFHGRVPHKDLQPYLAECNIGVTFVPIVKYQEAQPFTKVFEYLLAGMPMIATANGLNKKYINESNGVLIEDTTEGFINGLKLLSSRLASYDSEKIKADARKFSWTEIVNGNVRVYFNSMT